MDGPALELPPALLARYRLLALIGAGAHSLVYRARQLSLERTVVLKLVPVGAVSDALRRRFTDEARLIAGVRHPHVVSLLDHGIEGDFIYLAYPEEEGVSLERLSGDFGRLRIGLVVAVVRDVLEGLAHLHAMGIVHRDIKPANLLLTRDGRAKILDFGLARELAADRAHLTRTGEFIGTPLYASPGQILGHPADPRDDLYSLGVVAYELLAGVNPFDHPQLCRVLEHHLNTSPHPPIAHRPDVPQDLSRLVLELLAKSRDERPSTARAVVERLGRIVCAAGSSPSEAGTGWGVAPVPPVGELHTEPGTLPIPGAAPDAPRLRPSQGQSNGRPVRASSPRRRAVRAAVCLASGAVLGIGAALLAMTVSWVEPRVSAGPEVVPGVHRVRVRWRLEAPGPAANVWVEESGVERKAWSGVGVAPSFDVRVDGLLPGRTYRLWLERRGRRLTAPNIFRTLPWPSPDALSFDLDLNRRVSHVRLRTAFPVRAWLETNGPDASGSVGPARTHHRLPVPVACGGLFRIVLGTRVEERHAGPWYAHGLDAAVADALAGTEIPRGSGARRDSSTSPQGPTSTSGSRPPPPQLHAPG